MYANYRNGLGEKKKRKKIRILFSKNPILKANKKWGTAKDYVGREGRGKGWWKKLNMNQKCHCDGEKNKGKHSPDVAGYAPYIQGQSNCSALCRASSGLGEVCVPIWQCISGKLWASWGESEENTKSTRGLENTPCSDNLIVFSMNTKEGKFEIVFH